MKIEFSEEAKRAITPKPKQPEPKRSMLADIFVELRKLGNMTQADAADVIGLVRTSVVNMESGKQAIALDHLDKLADHLGLDLEIRVRPKASPTPPGDE